MHENMERPSILIKKENQKEPILLDFSHEYGELNEEKAEKYIRDYTQGHDGNFILEWYKDGKLNTVFKSQKN